MIAGSRRNLQSAGAVRQGSRRPPADEGLDPELPPYQEPRLPLTDGCQAQIRELSASRLNVSLQRHTEQSAKFLSGTVFAISDRATCRKDAVERAIKKRRGNNDDAGVEDLAEIEKLRNRADELKNVVDPLTLKVEKAMRDVLDMQAALLDEKELLKDLPAMVAMAQAEKAAEVQQNEAGDEDDDPPEVAGISINRVIEQDRDAKARAYNELSVFQKYAKDNAYIEFKRNWHDGLNLGDEIPVPDPKTWFDTDGQPQHVIGGDGDDSDDEIQIAREKRSFRCPLSLVALTEPYTCRRCKHTFQKNAIYDFLGVTGRQPEGKRAKCPEAGCNLQDMRKQDLYYDESLLRRIKRAEQAEREQDSSDREDEESQKDDTVEVPVKREASGIEADAISEDDD
ncbi:unnamed protein product [Discula destructiva]